LIGYVMIDTQKEKQIHFGGGLQFQIFNLCCVMTKKDLSCIHFSTFQNKNFVTMKNLTFLIKTSPF